jgi:arylsulfatase
MFGNRAIYHDGWVAATRHSIPWLSVPLPPVSDDIWELYNVNEDFSQAKDLAASNPAKLDELKKKFMTEAVKYNVLPIDDRSIERFDPVIAGRPDLMNGRTKLTLYEGAKGIPENAFINIKNTSLAITAVVDVPANASGVLLCQGGDFGGWSLFMMDGRITYAYNWVGLETYTITSSQKVAAGKRTITFDFAYDGGRGGGGTGTLSIDGQKVGEGRIAKTNSNTFGIDESADVGTDENTPVTPAYAKRERFTGRIGSVTLQTTPPAS